MTENRVQPTIPYSRTAEFIHRECLLEPVRAKNASSSEFHDIKTDGVPALWRLPGTFRHTCDSDFLQFSYSATVLQNSTHLLQETLAFLCFGTGTIW